MITLLCPSCQKKLNVKDELAGKKVRCPHCKQTADIPAAIEPSKPSFAEDATVPPSSPSFNEDATVPPRPSAPAETVLQPEAERNGDVADEAPSEALEAAAHYQVEGEIARGGMGAIMRAVDQDIRREVAVKFLLNNADDKLKARFVEEAQITGQLEHPNIVPIHQLGVHQDGRCFFSMKMVKGQSLAEILKDKKSKYTLGRLLNIFVSICNAMAYAHSREVIHRDLKPANIMVGDFGEVYVMDWGLAKVLGKDDPPVPPVPSTHIKRNKSARESTQPASPADSKAGDKISTDRQSVDELTQAGAIMGTPTYMPPEQAQCKDVDQRADIYSLGAILYEIMTLTPPVGRGGDMLAILMRVVEGQIAPPAARAPARPPPGWVPPELSAIALKALATKRKDRYQSVEKLKQDIELFLEGRSVSAKEDSFREMAWKLVKRNKAASAATGIGMLVLMAVLAVSFLFINAARVRAEDERGKAEEERGKAEVAQNKAEEAYQAYQKQVKDSAPVLLRAARLALNEQKFDDALVQASLAAKSDPDNAEARLLNGELLITRKRYAEAIPELEEYLKHNPDKAAAAKLAELCRKAQAEKADSPQETVSLLAFANLFTQAQDHALADGVLSGQGKNTLEVRKRLLEMYRKRIDAAWPGKGNNLWMSLEGRFSLGKLGKVTDLAPLRGIPLTSLDLGGNDEIRDLTPLKGMPLTSLSLLNCNQIRDLTPLKGMALTSLNLFGTPVGDLEPLKGMPLTSLSLGGYPKGTQVRDLEPLKGMPLKTLTIHNPASPT
jgi:serine/threonine protein kinase